MTKTIHIVVCALALIVPASASGQTGSPAQSTEHRIEIQTFTVATRYRFIENADGDVTANHVQFKDAFRARFNLARARKLSLNVGALTGSSFTSSWDSTGLGTGAGTAALNVRQLYASIAPVGGVELQVGGLAIAHGENSEITSYDDDGYATGERVVIRQPRLYFDEISATRAALGPISDPGILSRFDQFGRQHYWQAQVVKQVARGARVSADLTDASGVRTARAAIVLTMGTSAPISSLRYEQYRRMSADPAAGFAIVAERALTKRARLQGGYASIDPAYGGLNGDRYQQGRRVFALATVPIALGLAAQLYVTHAFDPPHVVSNHTRFDAVVTYDILAAFKAPSTKR